MADEITRRRFVKGTLAASAGAALATSIEEQVLLAQKPAAPKGTGAPEGKAKAAGRVRPNCEATLPKGKIGDLEISRLILGGNLIGGWAHARGLMYVSKLLKAYHTDEKVLDTLQVAEEHGVNCINTHPNAGPLIQRYRKERGGKMLWMVQAFCNEQNDFNPCIRTAVEQGVDLIHIQGALCDKLVREGKYHLLERGIISIQAQGLPAGVGAHSMAVPRACVKKGLKCDFYVKTLHHHKYPTGPKPDELTAPHREVPGYWCKDPKEVEEFMKPVDKPWVAFKVMAAGAIHPRSAFRYAFEHGADFVMAGMFDFQVAEDVDIARNVLAKIKKRPRPWRA